MTNSAGLLSALSMKSGDDLSPFSTAAQVRCVNASSPLQRTSTGVRFDGTALSIPAATQKMTTVDGKRLQTILICMLSFLDLTCSAWSICFSLPLESALASISFPYDIGTVIPWLWSASSMSVFILFPLVILVSNAGKVQIIVRRTIVGVGLSGVCVYMPLISS